MFKIRVSGSGLGGRAMGLPDSAVAQLKVNGVLLCKMQKAQRLHVPI